MSVYLLRAYLLAGLVAHKVVWEVMKRRRVEWRELVPEQPRRGLQLVKVGKAAILVGIVAQTLIPDRWVSALLIAEDPSTLRVIGVMCYTLGLLVAVLGRTQLGTSWADIEVGGVHSEQALISHGLYRVIRHPIYVGDLLLLLGLELALNSWLVLGAVALIPVVLRQAIREERILVDTLKGYREYCNRTKRFVPYLI